LLFGIEFLNYDKLSAVIFVILLSLYLYKNRENVVSQKIISIWKFPIVYILMLRTKIGLNFMDRMANKYREIIKILGYCSIGVGFFGMILIIIYILFAVGLLIFRPDIENGAQLVLPFTTIPGLGYLSFWHFLICVFFIMVIHEFAHGVVSRAHNVKVNSSGIAAIGLLFPIFPIAFVEPDEKQVKKKDDVVQYSIFAAGPTINIIVAFLFALLFLWVIFPFDNAITENDGFSYSLLNDSYPASLSGMPNSTIITTLNGEEVTTFAEFSDKMDCITSGEVILVGTEDGSYNVTTTESPTDPHKGFLGIRPIENKISIKDEYEKYSVTFFWLRGLIKWLFILNLLVGMFNLLPIVIFDGGRMFQIAIGRVVTEKEKSNKIITLIAIIFASIMVIMLLRTYVPKILSLLF